MTEIPTLEDALKLADQDCPLPSLAGPALKVLRNRIRQLALQRLAAGRYEAEDVADQANDSAALTDLIAELRAREALSRTKYGTDVDRTDLNNAQWRQHLREELMDALLYSLAEERTKPLFSGNSILPQLWSMVGLGDAVAEGHTKPMETVECGGCAPAVQASTGLPACWCLTCQPQTWTNRLFVVCPVCGNKRCPHAHDHRNACTGSNAVGQPGSSWEHVKPITPADPGEPSC